MDNKFKENQEVAGNSSSVASKLGAGPVAPRAELLESLSAMMDDEAESLETRRIVRSLENSSGSSSELSSELLGRWRRYHAVRASLQHEIHIAPSIDLLAGIKTRLADEAAINTNTVGIFWKSLRTGRMLRVAGQGLIAASVAAAVLLATPMLNLSQNGAMPGSAAPAFVADHQITVQDSLPAMNGDSSASALTRTVSLDDAARRRLETAVRNFSGTTAVLSSNNSAMFVNQLQPFATNTPAPPTVEQPAQRR